MVNHIKSKEDIGKADEQFNKFLLAPAIKAKVSKADESDGLGIEPGSNYTPANISELYSENASVGIAKN